MRLLVSWLRDFVDVTAPAEEIGERLGLRGFELAAVEPLGDDDAVIDFEITANRPDCLSVIGLAREVAALYDLPLKQVRLKPDATYDPVRLKPDATYDPVRLKPNTTDDPVRLKPDATYDPVRLKPDTTDDPVRLKPDTTDDPVRLKPDTTDDPVRLKPDATDDQARLKPDATYDPVRLKPDTTDDQARLKPDSSHDASADARQGQDHTPDGRPVDDPVRGVRLQPDLEHVRGVRLQPDLKVTIDDADLCPRYAALVADVTVGTSPAWLTYRLNAAGIRSISSIVDVTN